MQQDIVGRRSHARTPSRVTRYLAARRRSTVRRVGFQNGRRSARRWRYPARPTAPEPDDPRIDSEEGTERREGSRRRAFLLRFQSVGGRSARGGREIARGGGDREELLGTLAHGWDGLATFEHEGGEAAAVDRGGIDARRPGVE